MFGLIIPGRPVLTNPNQISDTQFAFSIPLSAHSPHLDHIVVFMNPGAEILPGAAAAIYLRIPPSPDFRLLGALANEKQSAVFRVSGGGNSNNKINASSGEGLYGGDMMTDAAEPTSTTGGALIGGEATIGISLEPAQQVAAALEAQRASRATSMELVPARAAATITAAPISTKLLAQRIISHAFNYLASFAGAAGGEQEMVPLKQFREWWIAFERKVDRDPGFLERESLE